MLNQADRHFISLRSNGEEGLKVPSLLDLELNTDCNLRCKKCFHSFNTPKTEKMDLYIVGKVIEEFAKKGGKSLKLIYRGEPLLYSLLPEVITLAKNKGIPRTVINTNGTLLNGAIARELVKAGLDQISFSIDACTSETYKLLHGQDFFMRIKRNVVGLQLVKKTILHSKTPVVVIHGVRQEGNEKEFDSGDYERFWIKLADDVEIRDYLDLEDWSEDKRKCKSFCCNALWERLVVLVNGNVLPCCSGYNYVEKKSYLIGNVRQNSLEEIWKSNILKEMRALHKEGKSHKIPMCKVCRGRKQFINEVEKNE